MAEVASADTHGHGRRRHVRFSDDAEQSQGESDDLQDNRSADAVRSLADADARDAKHAGEVKGARRYMAALRVGDGDGEDDEPPSIVKGFKPAFKLKARRTGRRRQSEGADAANAVAPSPDFIKAQFIWAYKSDNAALMEEALAARNADAPGGPVRRKLSQDIIDETLMYAMLSNNQRMTQLLIRRAGATVMGAAAAYDRIKGDLSGCDCGTHPGMLLVTLARQGALRMVQVALEGGVDPDASVCDGEARSLSWGEGLQLQGLQLVRSPVLQARFAKSTAMTAAATNNDLRMVKTLLRYGATMDTCGWAVVAEAAWVRDAHHQLLSFLLGSLTDNLGVYCNACAVALRAAASRGDKETVHWVIDRVDETEDWASGAASASAGLATGKTARRRRRRTLRLAQELDPQHGHQSPTTPTAMSRRSLSSELSAVSPTRASQASTGSLDSGTSASCLKPASMREYRGRRQSLVTKSDAAVVPPLSAAPPPKRARKPSLARRLTGGSGSSSSSGGGDVGAAAHDLVSFTVAKAIDGLIAEALEPGYVHREAFARGLEALAEIEQARVGAPVSLQARSFDLYRIFIDTLHDGLPGAAQDSALTLLHCGVEGFLDLGLTQRTDARTKASARRAAKDLVAAAGRSGHKRSGSHGSSSSGGSGEQQTTGSLGSHGSARALAAAGPRAAWDKVMCGLGRVAALPSRPIAAALQQLARPAASALASVAGSHASRAAAAERGVWGRRASLDEQMKALTVAVEGGHVLIVKHLLGAARRDMRVVVPRLLAAAARCNHVDLLEVLLDFFPDSEQLVDMAASERRSLGLSRQQQEQEQQPQNSDPVDEDSSSSSEPEVVRAVEDDASEALREALNNALLVALENHAEEFAMALVDRGARADRGLLVAAITLACANPEYPDSAAEFLLRLTSASGVQLTLGDAREIVDAAVNSRAPNLFMFASVMDLDLRFRGAVTPRHLAQLARNASNSPDLADWGDLLLMLLRCLETHPDVEDAVQEAYNAAVNVTPTHPGVLHILMDRAMQNEDDSDRWV